MNTTYTNSQGNSANVNQIKQGDEITIKVEIKNTDIVDQDNLALTVKAASGWEIINPRLYSTNEGENDNFNYQDYRDDKVYTYFELDVSKKRTYTFKVKANLKGDFYLPSIVCENMYDGNIYARTKASRTAVQ